MRTNSFCIALFACFLIGSAAQAENIYTYTLNLPSIANGAELNGVTTQYQFSWIGPYIYNAPPNSACPTVCGPVVPGSSVKAGYSFSGFDFTADLALSDPEAQINFSSDLDASNTVTFSFIEPDSFWAQSGSNIAFTNSNGDGTGATFAIGGTDPACTNCTVSISQSSSTPEPCSSILLAGPLALFAFAIWRKRASAIG